MWQELLSDIQKIEEKYGDSLNASASNEQIETFKKAVNAKFGHALPSQYINFLKTVNGLDNPSGTLMHTYASFDLMLEKALKDSLL